MLMMTLLPQVSLDLMSALLLPSLRSSDHLKPVFPGSYMEIEQQDPTAWPKVLSEYTMKNWKKPELPLPLFPGVIIR